MTLRNARRPGGDTSNRAGNRNASTLVSTVGGRSRAVESAPELPRWRSFPSLPVADRALTAAREDCAVGRVQADGRRLR